MLRMLALLVPPYGRGCGADCPEHDDVWVSTVLRPHLLDLLEDSGSNREAWCAWLLRFFPGNSVYDDFELWHH